MLQHFIFLQRFTTDGWVKKTAKAIKETYPYLTEKEIRGSIERLCKAGHVFSKIENLIKADRTKSFFVSELGHKMYGTEPFDKRANALTKRANGFDEKANDNLPKGQMLYKVVSSVDSYIVEGGEGTAHALEIGNSQAGVKSALKAESAAGNPPPVPPPPPLNSGPYLSDIIGAETPTEMEQAIARFYATERGRKEKEAIYANTVAGSLGDIQRKEVVATFAAWAIEYGYGRKTYSEMNARFRRWWKDQSRFSNQTTAPKQANQGYMAAQGKVRFKTA
jgi:hypothetical protein